MFSTISLQTGASREWAVTCLVCNLFFYDSMYKQIVHEWACSFLFRAPMKPPAPAAYLSMTDGPASPGASIYADSIVTFFCSQPYRVRLPCVSTTSLSAPCHTVLRPRWSL